MHVLNVNMTLDPVSGGGTAERTFQLCRALGKRNVTCTLLTLDLGCDRRPPEEYAGINLIALPCINRRYYVPRLDLDVIRNAVMNADIVHIMGHWTLINAIAYYYTRRQKKPYVLCTAGAISAKGRSRVLKYFYDKVVGRMIFRDAESIITISGRERSDVESKSYRTKDIVQIPNGIDVEGYQKAKDLTRPFNIRGPYVLFLGRLNEVKGPDLLLDAFIKIREQVPDHCLVYAGPDDGMGSILQKRVKGNSLEDKVHFLGAVRGSKKVALLREANLLVIPSRNEAMSIVVLEAAIVGTPIVATDVCGIDEFIGLKAFRSVRPDPEEISQGIMSLLDVERPCTELIRFVENNYSWDALVGIYEQLFTAILQRRGQMNFT